MDIKTKLKELWVKKAVETPGPFKDKELVKKVSSPLNVKLLNLNRYMATSLFIVHLIIGVSLIISGAFILSIIFFLTGYILVSYLKHTKK